MIINIIVSLPHALFLFPFGITPPSFGATFLRDCLVGLHFTSERQQDSIQEPRVVCPFTPRLEKLESSGDEKRSPRCASVTNQERTIYLL